MLQERAESGGIYGIDLLVELFKQNILGELLVTVISYTLASLVFVSSTVSLCSISHLTWSSLTHGI